MFMIFTNGADNIVPIAMNGMEEVFLPPEYVNFPELSDTSHWHRDFSAE